MSIKSTRTITRETAISRINEILSLVNDQDYQEIESVTSESDYNIFDFVNKGYYFNVSKWTNQMLEDQMDLPFYRFSMFENYIIGETTD